MAGTKYVHVSREEGDDGRSGAAAVTPLRPLRVPTAAILPDVPPEPKLSPEIQALKIRFQNIQRIADSARKEEEERTLRAEIKAKDARKSFYKREIPLYLTIATVTLLIMVATLSIPVAFPYVLLGGTLLTAANYILHSRNWKITLGRGIAMVIALTTALIGLYSAMLFFPVSAALVFSVGCFWANLVLFRDSVPKVIARFFEVISEFKKTWREVSWQRKTWWAFSSFLAIATGLVLTMSMAHAWGPGVALLFPAIASTLSSPYFFYPIMVVAFIANSAFVFRGLSRVFDEFLKIAEVFSNGVTYNGQKKAYEPNTDNTVNPSEVQAEITPSAKDPDSKQKFFGFKAVLYWYFNIAPTDLWYVIARKVLIEVVIKLGVITAIAVISQVALVDANIQFISETMPFFKDVFLAVVTYTLTIAAYSSRIGFVLVDLANLLHSFIKFASDSKNWAQLFNNLRWVFTKEARAQFVELMKEQTIDTGNIETYWMPVYGDIADESGKPEWERQLRAQREAEWTLVWNTYRGYYKIPYYFVKASITVIVKAFTWVAIILNTGANVTIAMLKGSDANVNPIWLGTKGAMGGTSSATLNTNAAINTVYSPVPRPKSRPRLGISSGSRSPADNFFMATPPPKSDDHNHRHIKRLPTSTVMGSSSALPSLEQNGSPKATARENLSAALPQTLYGSSPRRVAEAETQQLLPEEPHSPEVPVMG